MYMLKSVVTIAALTAYAFAQSTNLQLTTVPAGTVSAGSQQKIEWIGGDSTQPVTLILRYGNPGNLDTVSTIVSGATGGSYQWTIPSSITSGSAYAIEIQQGTVTNYSGLFAVTGGTGTAVPGATTAAATTTGSASASAAASSASSSASSAASSASSAASSASASASSKASSVSASLSSATRTAASTSSTASAPSTGGAGHVQSPIALIFGAVAAMLYLA